jgi:site-specific DNA-methyltransferase (adenine-specific)
MEFMKDKPDNYYDICLTDPPYNVGYKYNNYKDDKTEIEYNEWCDKWFNELMRICKTVVLTTGYKNIKYWINKNYKGIIYWIKPNQSSPSQLGGFNCVEHIFYFGRLNKRIGQDYFVCSIGLQKDASFHSCPKYYPAWKKILKMVAKENDKIFDPFLGSGTTRIACHELGFDFEGCELDKDYWNDQEERYKQWVRDYENKFYLPEDNLWNYGEK